MPETIKNSGTRRFPEFFMPCRLYAFVSSTLTPCMMISPASTAISSAVCFMPPSIHVSASDILPDTMNEQK